MADQREHGPATRTISRAMAILQAFDEARPELGVTELSELTELDKATVYRLLSALQQGGLIEKNRSTSKYHLGFGLVRLAGLALQHLDLPRIVRPYLEALAEQSQETVTLSVMTHDDKAINIDSVTSPRRVRNVARIGREMPLHAVSGGKVMLAYLPDDHLAQILAARLKRFTKQTITDALELRSALERIRQAGYAVAEEEFEEGLSAVAAPIRDAEGHVRAVIGVSGPSFRLPTDRLQELGRVTKRAADEISGHLGRIWQG